MSDDLHLDPAAVPTTPDGLTAYIERLIGASPEALIVLGEDLVVRWASAAVEHLFGWTPEQMLVTDPISLLHPDDVATALGNLGAVLDGGDPDAYRTTCRLHHRDGHWTWAEIAGRDLRSVPEIGAVLLSVRDVTHRVDAASALGESERQFEALVRHSNDCIVVTTADGLVTYVSPAMTDILGWDTQRLTMRPFGNGVDEPDRQRLLAGYDAVLQHPDEVRRIEMRAPHADGGYRWIETVLSNHLDDPEVSGMVATFRDVTERKEHLLELRERTEKMEIAERENRQLLAIFDVTNDLAILADPSGQLLYLNASARRFYGLEDADLSQVEPRDWIGTRGPEISGPLTDDDRWSGEVSFRRHDGVQVPMALQIFAHRDETTGQVDFYSGMAHDISNRKQLEASLEMQATHDELTGLPNRVLLFERIERAMDGLRNSSSSGSVALLFIDIDHFKSVNDTLGHAVGDRLLEQVAGRIRDAVRPGDTVARFGGDEFVVLCERLESHEDAVVIAHRLDGSLNGIFQLDERQVRLGISIGISYADPSDPDPIAVMRDADAAMYLAKAGGRGRWVIFDDDLRDRATERRQVERAMRSTLKGEELELHYQPVVALDTGAVTSVEALLRWRRDGVLVPPDEFVPLAEENGLIVPIGTWVIETACAQMAAWQRLPGWSHLGLAVNVSARQLQHPSFAAVAAAAASEPGLTSGTLSIEITETVLLEDVVASGERLEKVKAHGIGVTLDDFGTGYSSLTYLRRFPVDTVKLDRSFVAGVGLESGDTAIVTAIINLTRALGLTSIGEGIETETQRDMLRDLGCDSGQGFLFSRGLPPEEFEDKFLRVADTGQRS